MTQIEKNTLQQSKGRLSIDFHLLNATAYANQAIRHLNDIVESHDADCKAEDQKFSECTWETVFQTLDDAKSEYSSRGHYQSHAMMGMELAFKMTDLIPSEYGLSVIKSVLGIAFEVNSRP